MLWKYAEEYNEESGERVWDVCKWKLIFHEVLINIFFLLRLLYRSREEPENISLLIESEIKEEGKSRA